LFHFARIHFRFRGPERKMRKTVLVVDDVPENLALMIVMVKSFGYDAITAEDGRQAVEKAREFRPDLILMDLMMPVMDGLEATKIIREAEDGRTPIVAVTAYHRDYHHRALEAGCDGVIPKPINFDDLRSVIDHYLRGGRSFGRTTE
jgi:two-component system cell cycle response regulator DivK